ncbi:MAG: hypothetical protein ACREMY_29225, partial [bacterium]
LQSAVARLHESQWNDVDTVATEICHEISDAIAEHDRDLKQVGARYKRIHGLTATIGLAAAGVALVPSLAPFVGVTAPLALATKYVWDKIGESAEKRAVTKSLVGVVAIARARRP